MEHITIGRKYNEGKVAFVECRKNATLSNIDIKNNCFLLLILSSGKLSFSVGKKRYTAIAPSFLCFDESENPKFPEKVNAQYTLIFFHPKFLNVNMTFLRLRSANYDDIATTHDMFLLKPFIEKMYVIPITNGVIDIIEHSAECMINELAEQRDWYWSCRGSSYFMEIIIALERIYSVIKYGINNNEYGRIIKNPKLRDAIFYIEGHYNTNVTLADISANAVINHTTLTLLMKAEIGCTAMEYLMKYRIAVAKKELAFTDVPIKDIAYMVGFKTVQHFARVFKNITDTTPAEFRKTAVQNRKDEFNGK